MDAVVHTPHLFTINLCMLCCTVWLCSVYRCVMFQAESSPQTELTKVAIGVPGGITAEGPKYHYDTKVYCFGCNKEVSSPEVCVCIAYAVICLCLINDSLNRSLSIAGQGGRCCYGKSILGFPSGASSVWFLVRLLGCVPECG